jgi:hypothetical protein
MALVLGLVFDLTFRHWVPDVTQFWDVISMDLGSTLSWTAFAWRPILTAVLVMAIALWGFRNVLGKQTAFPSGALDG